MMEQEEINVRQRILTQQESAYTNPANEGRWSTKSKVLQYVERSEKKKTIAQCLIVLPLFYIFTL